MLYRKNRSSLGCGVLMSVHSIIMSRSRQDLVPDDTGKSDFLVIEISPSKYPKIILICLRNPPGNSPLNPTVYLNNILQVVTNV